MFSINVNKNSESTAIKKNTNAIYLTIISILLINKLENVSATHTQSEPNQQTGNPILPEKCHLIPNQDQVILTKKFELILIY
jgi:hypothetical protein